uniref:Selenide, water dikinase n=2 Tax=Amphimedon queenslandica TaxID=400682 RepID=A0AAN0IPW5_AMPQE
MSEVSLFDPVRNGLDKNFRLTNCTKLKGCGCKVPQEDLMKLLEGLGQPDGEGMGIGLDSCVMKTKIKGVFLIQTTDFFYPLVNDPYMQGKIACANVLSDLYAMGVEHCDNMLMLLGVSSQLSKKEKDVVTPLIIKGFNDLCIEAGTSCNGGQTVINPWFIIGGVASAVTMKEKFIMPDQAIAGDVLVLTKPLGTQIAVNAHQWIETQQWEEFESLVTKEQIKSAYLAAMYSMARLNKTGAKLMHKYGAHGATDVTGFGILGHIQNLARAQKESVSFVIHSLPILDHMDVVASKAADNGLNFKLREGFSAETSGGLVVILSKDKAELFCKEIEEIDKVPAWIIGDVVPGSREASISPDMKVINVLHNNTL